MQSTKYKETEGDHSNIGRWRQNSIEKEEAKGKDFDVINSSNNELVNIMLY